MQLDLVEQASSRVEMRVAQGLDTQQPSPHNQRTNNETKRIAASQTRTNNETTKRTNERKNSVQFILRKSA